jgi:hypothetical protein
MIGSVWQKSVGTGRSFADSLEMAFKRSRMQADSRFPASASPHNAATASMARSDSSSVSAATISTRSPARCMASAASRLPGPGLTTTSSGFSATTASTDGLT